MAHEYSLFCFNDYNSLNDLRNADFIFFKRQPHLSLEHKSVIYDYYNDYYNAKRLPFYHCLPTLNDIVGDNKFRFCIVTIGDDNVFFTYKIIQILTTRQIRVFDTPISKQHDQSHISTVLEILKNKEFVRFCFSEQTQPQILNKENSKRLVEYDNYYYSKDVIANVTTRKLNKWGIGELMHNNDFAINIAHSISLHDAKIIRKDFNEYLTSNKRKSSKNDDKEFFRLATSGHENIRIISIKYKCEIIFIRVLIILPIIGVAYSLYNMQRRRYDESDHVLKKFLSHNMTDKIKWITFHVLEGIEKIYMLGCPPSEHRLIKHKEKLCEGKIKYYIQ